MKSRTVSIDPERMGGTPCFVGTRVPVRTLLDYWVAGDTLDSFLDDFPGVSRETAADFLEEATACLLAQLEPDSPGAATIPLNDALPKN